MPMQKFLQLAPQWLCVLCSGLSGTFRVPPPFSEAHVEQAFLVDFGKRFGPFRRAAAAIGFLMWTACLGWDRYNYDHGLITEEMYADVLVLRTFGIAALLAAVVLSFQQRFTEDLFAHAVLLSGVLACACALIGMVIIVPPPLEYTDYFVSLYLVMIFMFGFLHLRAKAVLTATLMIGIAMLLAQIARWFGGNFMFLSDVHFPQAAFFYIACSTIGFGICVKFEYYARQQYAHERQLAAEQEWDLVRVQALLQAKEEQRKIATDANHNKSKFLASAAHDLRQPMFSLSVSLEALRDAVDAQDMAETRRLLLLSQRSARVMADSFDAVLELSRLESGFVAPQLTQFDLVELIEEVMLALGDYAGSKRCTLRVRVPATRVLVHSDRLWLGLVIKNLVSNGIKYRCRAAKTRCAVLIGVVRLGNRVRLDVIDNGMGIPASDWIRIFEPFVQLDNTARDRDKGLGLGLSIVNAIVSILDEHRLELKSRVGHGTRFSIDVPWACDDGTFAPDGPALQVANAMELKGVYVILIEDDELVRAALAAMFSQWGMLVETVDGLPALQATLAGLERCPDLVVTDYRLPDGATGTDVVDMVNACMARESRSRLVPVLLVTGEANSQELGIAAGAQAVLVKPVRPDRLKAEIEKLLLACTPS